MASRKRKYKRSTRSRKALARARRRGRFAMKKYLTSRNPGIKVGQRVTISFGSGIDSGKSGTVIDWSKVRTNSRGVPEIDGEYHTVGELRSRGWVPVKLSGGQLTTMPKSRLKSGNPRRRGKNPTQYPKQSYKKYKCVVCGHKQDIQTNHTGSVFDFCKGCSWKSFGFDHDNTMNYGGRAYRRFKLAGGRGSKTRGV